MDEETPVPLLSKCNLIDFGIKEYEEHFVELNHNRSQIIVSAVRNNTSLQRCELIASAALVVEDFATGRILDFALDHSVSYSSGFRKRYHSTLYPNEKFRLTFPTGTVVLI